ncbi:hypothetical protein FPV67DRAFT_1489744 [Lyophyllum atratum]|nr:hypothetical protein FPV67DRAFT_1489744 [Lyophyllum atratum]
MAERASTALHIVRVVHIILISLSLPLLPLPFPLLIMLPPTYPIMRKLRHTPQPRPYPSRGRRVGRRGQGRQVKQGQRRRAQYNARGEPCRRPPACTRAFVYRQAEAVRVRGEGEARGCVAACRGWGVGSRVEVRVRVGGGRGGGGGGGWDG